ncbi:D-galactarate dehydratase [Salmonella enterica]|nr:D-galactarate dehydratase [Salmonella enterica]ECI4985182.1 D-galactarate dehydratase [Salmonella enterica subsp. salamae]EHJ5091879.1 UxaA family hydrolase [Salmonella enterica subsp. salamae serovar 16:m,t:-]EAV1732455.1 D-galactarate dehydratase [Salmonella enterica]EBK3136235.1 D-galactarate dehydratase [Salmonella enterica]
MARLLIRESRTIAKELLVKKNAVVIHPQDGVATAITALRTGETATMFIGEQEISVVLRQAVPFGHKFAICDVPFHGEVYKYGESIGRATQEIKRGDYVHVHNVESARGRGDWK